MMIDVAGDCNDPWQGGGSDRNNEKTIEEIFVEMTFTEGDTFTDNIHSDAGAWAAPAAHASVIVTPNRVGVKHAQHTGRDDRKWRKRKCNFARSGQYDPGID